MHNSDLRLVQYCPQNHFLKDQNTLRSSLHAECFKITQNLNFLVNICLDDLNDSCTDNVGLKIYLRHLKAQLVK